MFGATVLYPTFQNPDEAAHVDYILAHRHGDWIYAPGKRSYQGGVILATGRVPNTQFQTHVGRRPILPRDQRPSFDKLGHILRHRPPAQPDGAAPGALLRIRRRGQLPDPGLQPPALRRAGVLAADDLAAAAHSGADPDLPDRASAHRRPHRCAGRGPYPADHSGLHPHRSVGHQRLDGRADGRASALPARPRRHR